MVDFKKLALGRKGIQKDAPKQGTPAKPEKTLEQSCKEEVDETSRAFRDRIAKEDKRRRLATDSEFWIAVCFVSREDKERFLRKYDLLSIGDKYLDGRMVERVLDKRSSQARDGHSKER